MSDEIRELVERCRSGEPRAIVDLVERFQDQVFGLCFRMLGQRQDAEDMTQESLVRAIRNLDRWDQARDFRPWLLAIAGNRCRTLLAARLRRPSSTSEVDQVPDRSPDVQGARNLTEEIELELEMLRGEYRQAFLLFHHQHLSYAEIAEVLDCPVGTAKTWVHRARRELAERLRRREIVQEFPGGMRRL